MALVNSFNYLGATRLFQVGLHGLCRWLARSGVNCLAVSLVANNFVQPWIKLGLVDVIQEGFYGFYAASPKGVATWFQVALESFTLARVYRHLPPI